MIEEGTVDDFKECVLEQLWTWEFGCGHTLICDYDYRNQFDEMRAHSTQLCPECRATAVPLPVAAIFDFRAHGD